MIDMTRDEWLAYCRAEAAGDTEAMKRIEEEHQQNGMDNTGSGNFMFSNTLDHLEETPLGNGPGAKGKDKETK